MPKSSITKIPPTVVAATSGGGNRAFADQREKKFESINSRQVAEPGRNGGGLECEQSDHFRFGVSPSRDTPGWRPPGGDFTGWESSLTRLVKPASAFCKWAPGPPKKDQPKPSARLSRPTTRPPAASFKPAVLYPGRNQVLTNTIQPHKPHL